MLYVKAVYARERTWYRRVLGSESSREVMVEDLAVRPIPAAEPCVEATSIRRGTEEVRVQVLRLCSPRERNAEAISRRERQVLVRARDVSDRDDGRRPERKTRG